MSGIGLLKSLVDGIKTQLREMWISIRHDSYWPGNSKSEEISLLPENYFVMIDEDGNARVVKKEGDAIVEAK
jgi:hypothetical protein